MQSNIQDGIYFWIGLNITLPQKTWTWLDGTPLHLQLFQVLGQDEDNACAVITKKGVFSEKCCNQSYWVQAEEAAATPEALLTKMSEVQETKPISSAYFKSLVDLKVREWGSILHN
ncbi:killer cell lectin-like receptor subfamily F member 1 isoform X2 [Mirounga angustirostris]|uniref:killer cell lectin-like receptor subfamily F member 1 isoform X2 n=1 Tax=Mirounga angustirostris TaxID=9716 RepID=UPI001E68CBAB